ncbi:MAG TPA: DUF1189 family protein [Nitrospirae bacterium]|nr:DUF1189 family protein [Nitrospirota bacterium]
MNNNEKKKFSIFHAPFLSFFSSELYRDVAYRWKGLGIAYLCFITLFFVVPEVIKIQKDLNNYINEVSPNIIRQFPVLEIKEGVLSINASSPYKIYYKQEKKPLIIIDTTKAYNSPKDAKVLIYINERSVFFKKTEDDYTSIDFSKFDDMVITHETLTQYVQAIKQSFIFFFSPFIYLFALMYFVIQVIFCASVGLLIAKKTCPELNFTQLMRLSSIAFTPPLFLVIVHSILNIEFTYSGPVSLLFTICYLYFGLRAVSDKQANVN